MADLTKEQLHEGYQLARAGTNLLKGFKHAEEIFQWMIQLEESREALVFRIQKLKVDADVAAADTAEAVRKRDAVRAEFDQEVVRLADYRKTEKAKIDEELQKEKAACQEQVRAAQGAVQRAQQDHAEVIKELKAVREDKRAEIAAEQARFDKLKAEHEAFKQKVL